MFKSIVRSIKVHNVKKNIARREKIKALKLINNVMKKMNDQETIELLHKAVTPKVIINHFTK